MSLIPPTFSLPGPLRRPPAARLARAMLVAAAALLVAAPASRAEPTPGAAPETRDAAAETRNAAIVRAAFEAWRKGGNVFAELLAPDFVWIIHGSSSVAGTYRGMDDFVGRASSPLTSRLTGPVVPDVRHIWASGDRVIVRFDGSATTTSGAPYRNQFVWIFRMKDGAAVEVEAFLDLVAYDRVVANNAPRAQ
jgi:ketosteroid isomerase-like protein